MATFTQNLDEISVLTESIISKRPSFSFAKRHGVLVSEIENGVAMVISRVGATPAALAELRRFLGLPLKVESVSRERYEALSPPSH